MSVTQVSKYAVGLLLLCGLAHAQVGQHKVTLTWTASSTVGVTKYNIYRAATAGICNGNPTVYASVSGTPPPTQFIDILGLVDGQTIFYNISSVKGGVEGACDTELQVQIPVLPAAPTNFVGTTQ